MPLPPIWERDAEPLDRTVKVRLSVRQLEHLDLAVKEFRMSRSWVLRESFALGFPLFVDKVRQRRRAGLVPRGEYQNPNAAGPLRGPRSDGRRADGWVNAPKAREPQSSWGAGKAGLSRREDRGKRFRHQEVYFSMPTGLLDPGSGCLVPDPGDLFQDTVSRVLGLVRSARTGVGTARCVRVNLNSRAARYRSV